MMGSERKSAVISDGSRKLTAFHEAGHALVAIHTDGAHPVHKATIVPRGMSLGLVVQLPDKDETSVSCNQMLAKLDVLMGGRVAEELIFGKREVTSGASSDLQQATSLARAMVTKYGMSNKFGLVADKYDDDRKTMSTDTRKEVRRFLDRAYDNAKTILITHSTELHVLASALLERETLTGTQIDDLLAQVNPKQPKPAVYLSRVLKIEEVANPAQQTVTSQDNTSQSPSEPPSKPSQAAFGSPKELLQCDLSVSSACIDVKKMYSNTCFSLTSYCISEG
ncbi:hypothetical protein MKW94_021118 [Papaver nudicaule]|uniref:Peptidase M41 domain-containing protein n=2 Tax=Papaver nudicaule TaxID=74823 RepID=A0AA41W358_PAPNU|nr:hypothetical protein [Papaver nudicaule]